MFDLTGNKSVSRLQSGLCGAQRVPTILISNPAQSFSEINLHGYTVLDCEPLHDLKGHIPHILTGESKTCVCELLQHLLLSKKQVQI